MTDLTADLQSLGIPTLDHKTYVMKVFFPGVNDHPILNDPKVSTVPLFQRTLFWGRFTDHHHRYLVLLAFTEFLPVFQVFNRALMFFWQQRRLTGPRTNYDAAMMQFEQLICNKHFLLTFIETLESQKTFSIRDK